MTTESGGTTGLDDPDENGVLRHKLIAIATSEYKHSPWREQPLTKIDDELATMRRWLRVGEVPPEGTHQADGAVRFTEPYPRLAAGPTLTEVQGLLMDPPVADRLRESDAAVLYVTGHGHVTDNRVHFIVLNLTEAGDRTSVTALKSSDLIEWLTATKITHLLILLDLCYSGLTAQAMGQLAVQPRKEWVGYAAAGPDEPAREQALTKAIQEFIDELGSTAGEKYAGSTERYLKLGDFVRTIQQKLAERGQVLVQLFPQVPALSELSYCLPNPNYRPRQNTERDFAAHWDPSSRGVAKTDDPSWRFTGRDNLMAELVRITTGPATTVVVTGAAGTGKSATLARLVTLSNADYVARHQRQVDRIPLDQRPAVDAVDAAVLAHGSYSVEVLAQLCRDLKVPTAGFAMKLEPLLERWRDWLARRSAPVTIVIDGLDEASNPLVMLTSLIERLDVAPTRRKIRLIVGVRSPRHDDAGQRPSPGFDSLADLAEERLHAVRLRVDEPPWWNDGDLSAYLARILTTTAGSPYRAVAAGHTETIAAAAAMHSRRSFLVAQRAADYLARRVDSVELDDLSWQATIDEGVAGIFRADLEQSLKEPADRQRAIDLLRAVAYARGPGLPWDDVWPVMANAIADLSDDHGYTDNDIDWLLKSRVGAYLSIDSTDGTTVYRLFHEALRDSLRTDPAALLRADR